MSEYVMDYSGWAEGIPAVEYLKVRDAMHARKREEIVRCRDCRYYDQNDEPSEVYPDRYLCDLMANFLHPDGFCAWGERRDA